MAAGDRLELRNPDPAKNGARIPRDQYRLARRSALATLPATGPRLTLPAFGSALDKRLRAAKGWDRRLSVSWYPMAIKLDLKARGELKRGGSPQRPTRA